MSKEKRVTKRQSCRNFVNEGLDEATILSNLSDIYVGEGKDRDYANNRAKQVLYSIKQEQKL